MTTHGSFDPEEALSLATDAGTAALVSALAGADGPLSAAELAERTADPRRDVEDRLAQLLAADVVEPATATDYRLADGAVELFADAGVLPDREEAAEDDETPLALPGDGDGPEAGMHEALVDALANRGHRPEIDAFVREHGLEAFAAVLYHAYRVRRGELTEREAAAELDVDPELVTAVCEVVDRLPAAPERADEERERNEK